MPDARRLTELPEFDPCALYAVELAEPPPAPAPDLLHPVRAALDIAENAARLGVAVWCRLLAEGAVALAELLHGRRPY